MMSRTWISETSSTRLEHLQHVGVDQAAFAGLDQDVGELVEVARLARDRVGESPQPAARSHPFVRYYSYSLFGDRAIRVMKPQSAQDFHFERLHGAGIARRARGRNRAGAACRAPPCGPSARASVLRCSRASRATTGAQITRSPRMPVATRSSGDDGKRQHVGRLVLAAVLAVEATALGAAHDAQARGRARLRPMRASGACAPAARRARAHGRARPAPQGDRARAPRAGAWRAAVRPAASDGVPAEPRVGWLRINGPGRPRRPCCARRPARSAAPAGGARRRAR